MTCNVHMPPHFVGNTWYGSHWRTKLDDETLADIQAVANVQTLTAEGALVGLTAAGIITVSTATTVGLALAAAVAAGWAWIELENHGCGVVIDFYLVDASGLGNIPLYEVSSQ